uniref:Uncharacterized protein n=1 Tax=Rhizophora mucronata TaxID=61149 RepID=A0A2P2PXI8_RHIMU
MAIRTRISSNPSTILDCSWDVEERWSWWIQRGPGKRQRIWRNKFETQGWGWACGL